MVEMRHDRGFPENEFEYPELDPGGLYQWRQRGVAEVQSPWAREWIGRLRLL